ncbi:peptidoglycan-binding domain-containing protein [Schumannella luteola]
MPETPSSKEVALSEPRRVRPRRLLRWTLSLLVVLALGAAAGWAAAVVLAPPRDVVGAADFTFVEVKAGEVGSSLNFNTVAAWTTKPVASNLTSGTVTSVSVAPGQEVSHGTTLYTVNLRPVAIAQGSIPAFRSLAQGAEGADVAQLQQFLATIGTYSGPVDGDFDYSTTQAVKAWQKLVGVEADGAMQAGDLVYVPTLPARIALDSEKVTVGAVINQGDTVVLGLPSSPTFRIPLTSNQGALVPLGTRVEITGPNGEQWQAFAAEQKTTETGIDILLAPEEGQASICLEACGSIPVSGEASLRSQIIIVEAIAGLTVPSAALNSRADGSIVVFDEEGLEHAVTVVASAKGMSLVEGVPAGLLVRVPAAE